MSAIAERRPLKTADSGTSNQKVKKMEAKGLVEQIMKYEARERLIKDLDDKNAGIKFADRYIGNYSGLLNFLARRDITNKGKLCLFLLAAVLAILSIVIKYSLLACFIALTWKWING